MKCAQFSLCEMRWLDNCSFHLCNSQSTDTLSCTYEKKNHLVIPLRKTKSMNFLEFFFAKAGRLYLQNVLVRKFWLKYKLRELLSRARILLHTRNNYQSKLLDNRCCSKKVFNPKVHVVSQLQKTYLRTLDPRMGPPEMFIHR